MKSKKPSPKLNKNVYSFTGRLEKEMYGNFGYAGADLPASIVEGLPPGRLRTKGTLNKIPFALGIQFRKDGRRFFLFSKALCKKAEVKIGDRAKVQFNLVDPELVDIPEELDAVLAQDDEARKIWDAFTTGRRRSLVLYVTPAKNVDVRIKRSLELANKIKAGKLYVQKKNT